MTRSCWVTTVESVCWWVLNAVVYSKQQVQSLLLWVDVIFLQFSLIIHSDHKEGLLWSGSLCVPRSFPVIVASLSLPFLCITLPLLKWPSKTNIARHFSFNPETSYYNQIAFAEILLSFACCPQKIPLKIFHLILTDENPFSVAMWAPFSFYSHRAPGCALVLLVRAEGILVWSASYWSSAAPSLLHSVTLHQHCAHNVITGVGIGSRRACECKHITMRHKRVLS